MKILRHWRLLLVALLLLANTLVWLVVWREDRGGILTVAILDIGQGDSILIEAPNGNQVLVDGGAGRQILRALGGVLPFYDRFIDLVIATHPDADHIGGLVDVFQHFQVGGYLDPGMESDTIVWQTLKTRVTDAGLDRRSARRDLKIWLADDVILTVLYPDRDPNPRGETNDASIVARLDYGDTSFLLTGDAPTKTIENNLLTTIPAQLSATVLKVGHHGSRYSTSERFLAAVAPRYAAISVGAKNRYGHPAPEVLTNLEAQKIPTLRTDQVGTIIFRTDGQNLTYQTEG